MSSEPRCAGDPGAIGQRPRGKLVVLVALVLTLVVLVAACLAFRTEITNFCLRTYWRLKGEAGTVGITVAEESGGSVLRIIEVTRRPSNAVLKEGDVIVRVAGEDVNTLDGMMRAAGQRRAGDVLPFVVCRGAETLELEVMLEPRPPRR